MPTIAVVSTDAARADRVVAALSRYLQREGRPAEIVVVDPLALLASVGSFAVVVALDHVPPTVPVPVVSGMPFVLGTDPRGALSDLHRALELARRRGA
ncbi:hypothetical protein JSY14_09590 [Brachybacterium sp. EF45031]|uniref:hypothetical protein n=1 Tax=Brachybacterium sillae TaxID=2810536 RepID=UPI00217D5B62|nr:hypothetical protein [Brachybacterium sillae]MCS6712257.1 hypothetical protein [Brachybacterium sillae]